MKKSVLIISSLLLATFVGCSNPSSSEPSSSEPSIVDTRTPKEKVLDLCEEIIEKK